MCLRNGTYRKTHDTKDLVPESCSFCSFAVESALKPNNHFEVDVVLKDPRNKRFAWNEKLAHFDVQTCSSAKPAKVDVSNKLLF